MRLGSCRAPGTRLVHLDLHPENVILSPRGPVVIDWTNARRAEEALDVAMTWVILATSARGLRARVFLDRFLSRFDRSDVVRSLPQAGRLRRADANVTDKERAAVERLVEGVTSRRWR
jgi:aminoglycoside phosphotransferase (APT) family kinase protein